MVTEPKMHFSKYHNSSDEPQKKTIVLPVITPTPNLTHISLTAQVQRVQVTPVSPPVPSQRVTISQPTTPQRVQKEVSKTKPPPSTPPVQNKTTTKTKYKTKKETPYNDSQQQPLIARIL